MAHDTYDSHEADGFFARPLVALARFCGRYPWLVLAAVLVSSTLSIVYTNYRLTYLTHRNDLISQSKDYYQRWKKFIKEFGADDDLVVAIEGTDRAKMETALEELAAKIAAEPDRFDRLNYKVDLRPLRNRALLFLPTEQVRSIAEHLRPMAMLLEPPLPFALIDPLMGWRHLTLYEMTDKAALNGNFNPEAKENVEQDALLKQLSSTLKKGLAYLDDPTHYQSPWVNFLPVDPNQKDMMAEPLYFFSNDGTLGFLTTRATRDDKDGFTFAQKSVDRLREIVAETSAKHPEIQVGITGIPVLENDEMASTQSDSSKAGWIALAGVLILYLAVYRTLRTPLMTISAMLVGLSWSLAWLTLTVGHLNILSSAFAVMLIGMGDFGVLWVTRFAQERGAGASIDEANRITAARMGPSILTAALTMAVAFFATMLADLKAVAELGWIAGCGVLLCALSNFIVMPALLSIFDCRHKKVAPGTISLEDAIANRRRWLPAAMRRPRTVFALSALATIVFGYFASTITYDHNLLRLQAPSLESVRWQNKVLEKSPEGNLYAVSITNTPEEALALKRRYEQLPAVSRVVEVASLVPAEQNRKLESLSEIQLRLRKLPARGTVVEHEAPKADEIVRATGRLLAALEPVQQSRPSVFLADLIADLKTMRDRFASKDSAVLCRRLHDFEVRMASDLMEDLHKLREVAVPMPITLADIPTNLRERYVGYTGKWQLAVFAKRNLWEYENLADFVSQVQTVDSEATGRPCTILEGLRAMQSGFSWAGIYALVAIVIVLLLDFRTIRLAAIALIPLTMGMASAVGVLALFGGTLNPANLIAFPLILGVGVDNGVHVLNDYRRRTKRKPYELGFATGYGIFISAVTTIVGFGTLMIAQHKGLASLGLALTVGQMACMCTALLFLPAMLGDDQRHEADAEDAA